MIAPYNELLAIAGFIEPEFIEVPDGEYEYAYKIKSQLVRATLVPANNLPTYDPFWELIKLPLPLPRFRKELIWKECIPGDK